MAPEIKQRFLTENDCYQAGRTIRPRGVMVHSTGVAQPDPEVFLRSWNRPDVAKCVHAFVARDGIIQTLPWDHRGWHAGTGTSGGSANNTHISFECCEPAGHTYQGGDMVGYDAQAQQPYFDDIYAHAVRLTAMLCKTYELDPLEPGVVICHAEGYDLGIASNHGDVLQWWPKHDVSMDDFRRDVAAAMSDSGGEDGGENGEDDDMTQARFDELMQNYLEQVAQMPPADWSAEARRWAEENKVLAGDDTGRKRYKSNPTREEVVQMLYRASLLER